MSSLIRPQQASAVPYISLKRFTRVRINRIFFSRQFLCFCLIGVLNTLLHGTILVALVELAKLGVVLSNLVAFIGANFFSYFANTYMTFKLIPTFSHYMRFLFASLISLLLTLFIAWAADLIGLYYWAGFALIIIVVPGLSYLIMRLWVFSRLNKG